MENGAVQIYYGEGHGKTNVAIGSAICAACEGKQAVVIQFLKGKKEPEFLKKLEPSQLPAMENSPATSPTAKIILPFMRKTTSAEMFVARFIALLTPFASVTGI